MTSVFNQTVSNKPKPFVGYLLAILAATGWASGGLIAKWLFTPVTSATLSWAIPPLGVEIAPEVLSAERALLSFLILFIMLLMTKQSALRIGIKDASFFAVFGICGLAMMHYTYFKAISVTSASTAILLEYFAPVLIMIFGVIFLRERPSWRLPAGVCCALVGAAFVVGALGGDGLIVSPAGIFWGLGAAVFFSTYSLLGDKAGKRYDSRTSLVFGLGFAALFWLVILGPGEIIAPLLDLKTFLTVVLLSVISTIVPFWAFLKALTIIPPANATMTSMLEPFLIAFGEFVLFKESLTFAQIIGGVLVIVAIVIVQSGDLVAPKNADESESIVGHEGAIS